MICTTARASLELQHARDLLQGAECFRRLSRQACRTWPMLLSGYGLCHKLGPAGIPRPPERPCSPTMTVQACRRAATGRSGLSEIVQAGLQVLIDAIASHRGSPAPAAAAAAALGRRGHPACAMAMPSPCSCADACPHGLSMLLCCLRICHLDHWYYVRYCVYAPLQANPLHQQAGSCITDRFSGNFFQPDLGLKCYTMASNQAQGSNVLCQDGSNACWMLT